MQVFLTVFMFMHFRFVIFCPNAIIETAARKMLANLTTDENEKRRFFWERKRSLLIGIVCSFTFLFPEIKKKLIVNGRVKVSVKS